MRMKKANCKGCYSYENETCAILERMKRKDFNTLSICPCSICLVKMTCIKGCPEYKIYTERIEKEYFRM